MNCEICGVKIDKVYQLIVSPGVVGITSRYEPTPIKLPIERNLKMLKVCKKCQNDRIGERE